ncbi:unnamed protein product [Cylicocyclus nassatus]|uniref:Uncharacterized protein n=1 Tax=Cylicocyclus nassatus TaxID=53992 RepID=A0AA36MIS6_CYLNA|nr:unnamed protein product [Cylicocyclus nassatus]
MKMRSYLFFGQVMSPVYHSLPSTLFLFNVFMFDYSNAIFASSTNLVMRMKRSGGMDFGCTSGNCIGQSTQVTQMQHCTGPSCQTTACQGKTCTVTIRTYCTVPCGPNGQLCCDKQPRHVPSPPHSYCLNCPAQIAVPRIPQFPQTPPINIPQFPPTNIVAPPIPQIRPIGPANIVMPPLQGPMMQCCVCCMPLCTVQCIMLSCSTCMIASQTAFFGK